MGSSDKQGDSYIPPQNFNWKRRCDMCGFELMKTKNLCTTFRNLNGIRAYLFIVLMKSFYKFSFET